jgi:hypothetical protein
VFAAVLASLLLNWYFTAPRTPSPSPSRRNLLALVLFVNTVAVAVSSVVHPRAT